MAGRLPRLLAATLLVAGTAWILPIHDDDPTGNSAVRATHVAPSFVVKVRRGTLRLSGHAVSAQHERRLRQSAEAAFPGLEVTTDFRPLGIVPDWWPRATTQLVRSLAATESTTALLDAQALQVSALAGDPDAAGAMLDSLQLPAEVRREVRLESVDHDISARALCERQFVEFEALPIQFEESGTEFRQSAYPALDKIAALANACRHATIFITGHTDSSGNEDWNRILSRRRAEAVADHLESVGIEGERLRVEGRGSDVPIADNETRFGRSLNRRIDVRFAAGD